MSLSMSVYSHVPTYVWVAHVPIYFHVPPCPTHVIVLPCPHPCFSSMSLFLPQFQEFQRDEQKGKENQGQNKIIYMSLPAEHPCAWVCGKNLFWRGFQATVSKIRGFAPVCPHLAVKDSCGSRRTKTMDLCWRKPAKLSSIAQCN